MPAWLAAIVQFPAVRIVTVAPLVPDEEHTVGVSEKNVTGLPEPPPLAETVNGGSPSVLVAREANVIDCAALATVNDCVTCGAGL